MEPSGEFIHPDPGLTALRLHDGNAADKAHAHGFADRILDHRAEILKDRRGILLRDPAEALRIKAHPPARFLLVHPERELLRTDP